MKRRADQQPGFVLHSYAYRETSLIVEAFTRHFGRIALVARGARRPRSALRGVLLAFQPLRLSWSGGELPNLLAAEWSAALQPLSGVRLMCGFYFNELLLRLVPREDPHEALFDAYAESLARLASGAPHPAVLRSFERRLLAELGYAPLFERDSASRPIDPERLYVYQPDRGPEPANGAAAGAMSGRTLLDMARDDYTRPETRDEARALMRVLIGERLHGQPLHTRSVLAELNAL